VETSRPTTHRDPIYVAEDVIHYCVPNVPARVARTASHAWSNAVLPYVTAIADLGIDEAIRSSAPLRRGVALACPVRRRTANSRASCPCTSRARV